jgi:hypothetical protein
MAAEVLDDSERSRLDQLSPGEIDAEVAAARKARRESRMQSG